MPCKQNGGKKREPPQNILIARIWKDVNGTSFFDIWLFLPKCLKNTVKQVSPLIFHFLWSINGTPVLPEWRKVRWVQRRQHPGCSVDIAGGQVVKGRLGHTCPWCQRGFSLLQRHRVCTALSEPWVTSSHLQCWKGELGLVGGWVWAASDELTSQIPISLSPPIALLSLLWAGLWLCPALPTQLCLVLGSTSLLCCSKGHGHCYRADGWLGSTLGDRHCMNNIVLNSKT